MEDPMRLPEYEQYRLERLQEPSRVEEDFLEMVKSVDLKGKA